MTKFQIAWTGEQPADKPFLQFERYILHQDVVGNVVREAIYWTDKGYLESYLSLESVQEDMYNDGKKLLDTKFAKKTITDTKAAVANFWEVTGKIQKDFKSNASNQKVLAQYNQYSDAIRKVLAYFTYSREEVMKPVEERLITLAMQNYHDSYQEKLLTITTPTERDLLYREKFELLKLYEDPSRKNILTHTIKYPFMLANIISEDVAFKVTKKRLEESTKENIQNELSALDDKKRNLKKEQNKILDEAGNKELNSLVWFVQQASLNRLKIKGCWGGDTLKGTPFLRH